MYIDYGTLLSNNQAITADAASTNAIDMGDSLYPSARGGGAELVAVIHVAESFNNLTSLTIKLQTDDDEAFGAAVDLTFMSLTLAELTAGRRVTLGIPTEGLDRYLRLYYDVTGTNPSTGKIRAWVASPDSVEGRSVES